MLTFWRGGVQVVQRAVYEIQVDSQMGKESFIDEIRRRSAYLHNEGSIRANLTSLLDEVVPNEGAGMTIMAGSGYGLRGIIYGIPASYHIMWVNLRHEKLEHYKGIIEKGWYGPYNTMRVSALEGFYESSVYKECYVPYGLKDGIQTSFFDKGGKRLGLYACLRFSTGIFSDADVNNFGSASPYIFSSLLRYRWLLELDFFSKDDYYKVPFGIIVTDLEGRITYTNEYSKVLLGKHHGRVPEELPGELKRARDAITSAGGSDFEFRPRVEEWLPYGAVLPLRCNREQSFGLPVEEESFLYVIDVRYIDHEMAERVTARELDIIKCLELGISDKVVGERLHISERTVHTHIRNIFEKLEVENRTQIVVKARTLGLI